MQSYKATSSILSFLSLLPNGVLSMSASRPGLVESSSNLGIASSGKDGFRFDVYSRSSVEPVMDKIEMTLERLAKVTGLSYHFEDRAPGWRFEPDSALQKDFCGSTGPCSRTRPRRRLPPFTRVWNAAFCSNASAAETRSPSVPAWRTSTLPPSAWSLPPSPVFTVSRRRSSPRRKTKRRVGKARGTWGFAPNPT